LGIGVEIIAEYVTSRQFRMSNQSSRCAPGFSESVSRLRFSSEHDLVVPSVVPKNSAASAAEGQDLQLRD